MSFSLYRTRLWTVTALLLACQQEGLKDDKSDDGGTGGTETGATGGMPSTMAGTGGSGGSDMSVSGSSGAPAVGGTAGTPGAGAPGMGGSGGEVLPMAGMGGLAAGDGGAPAAGMSGSSVGGAEMAGTGGDTTAGTGGTATGAGMGGMSGAGGAATAHPCPDGCAELSVPFSVWNAGQYFEIYLSGATDLSAAVINVKARKIAGKAGGLLIVVKDGSAQNYAYAQGAWNSLNDMTGEFQTFTLDVAAPSSTDENNEFTASAVQIITVQLAAGDPWYLDETKTMEDPSALVNPTVVQIDEITITGTGTLPGPWPFTSDASAIKPTITDDGVNASPPYAVTGSTATWIGP